MEDAPSLIYLRIIGVNLIANRGECITPLQCPFIPLQSPLKRRLDDGDFCGVDVTIVTMCRGEGAEIWAEKVRKV